MAVSLVEVAAAHTVAAHMAAVAHMVVAHTAAVTSVDTDKKN